ncbi:MAG: hypothetical protein A2Y34_09505 [Spirochaetes bacterium GWC1_27_15]|nr:MAG: hypothetical protein A2Z98_09545 [Spirochaetes bacterium GWB1_27_13]OHD21658.1 MAG: hypothetical protein A2Y34_09505 [Spirochaetes bacterium GWC1_27_15]
MIYNHIFGPVPSRRLGLSLGVEIVPYKVCSFNCIYCECGKTQNLTIERKEYIPVNEIILELKDFLKDNPTLDFITITGSGEPTLNIGLGKIAKFIKDNYPKYKLALLTNGSLLWDKSIQEELKYFDVVKPSLDAVSFDSLEKINNPNKFLDSNKIIEGLIDFRSNFFGQIWLEVFIIPEINDTNKELQLLKDKITKIKPDRIQLNSIDRPPAFKNTKASSKEHLEEIRIFFEPLPVEIISKANAKQKITVLDTDMKENIISILKRRPCTIEDLFEISGIDKIKILHCIEELKKENMIEEETQERGVFFKMKNLIDK